MRPKPDLHRFHPRGTSRTSRPQLWACPLLAAIPKENARTQPGDDAAVNERARATPGSRRIPPTAPPVNRAFPLNAALFDGLETFCSFQAAEESRSPQVVTGRVRLRPKLQ
jgi:hypothetical protein